MLWLELFMIACCTFAAFQLGYSVAMYTAADLVKHESKEDDNEDV